MCTKYEGRAFLCSSYVHTVCFLITILFKLYIWVFDNPSDWHLSLVKPVWVQIVAAVHVWRNARVPKLLLYGKHFVDRLASSDAKTFHSNCSMVMNNDQFHLLHNLKRNWLKDKWWFFWFIWKLFERKEERIGEMWCNNLIVDTWML